MVFLRTVFYTGMPDRMAGRRYSQYHTQVSMAKYSPGILRLLIILFKEGRGYFTKGRWAKNKLR
jgi:hypothetical protein